MTPVSENEHIARSDAAAPATYRITLHWLFFCPSRFGRLPIISLSDFRAIEAIYFLLHSATRGQSSNICAASHMHYRPFSVAFTMTRFVAYADGIEPPLMRHARSIPSVICRLHKIKLMMILVARADYANGAERCRASDGRRRIPLVARGSVRAIGQMAHITTSILNIIISAARYQHGPCREMISRPDRAASIERRITLSISQSTTAVVEAARLADVCLSLR